VHGQFNPDIKVTLKIYSRTVAGYL